MAVEQDDNRVKRTDLPDRAAKRIVGLLFGKVAYKADDPKYDAHAAVMTQLFVKTMEDECRRAIWEEMIAIEGEMALGVAKGLPE
jgi:hypothetical protein